MSLSISRKQKINTYKKKKKEKEKKSRKLIVFACVPLCLGSLLHGTVTDCLVRSGAPSSLSITLNSVSLAKSTKWVTLKLHILLKSSSGYF